MCFYGQNIINREQNIVLDDNCKCAEIHKVADTSQKLTVYGRPIVAKYSLVQSITSAEKFFCS